MTDHEARAREMLAAEYERCWCLAMAQGVRDVTLFKPEVRAIVAFGAERAEAAGEVTANQIDAGARYLRETQQGGKQLTEWDRTAKATKRKWLALSEGVLRAALARPVETEVQYAPCDALIGNGEG